MPTGEGWITWEAAGETGFEDFRLTGAATGAIFVGIVDGPAEESFSISYTVICDSQWRTRSVSVTDIDGYRGFVLVSDGEGYWTGGAGEPIPALDGATDVDISATPSTNTLPIRRLDLDLGESADILAAFVSVPTLEVTPEPQRYTRLSHSVYRFESLSADFTREITVDDAGFVIDYPGLFSRSAASPEE